MDFDMEAIEFGIIFGFVGSNDFLSEWKMRQP